MWVAEARLATKAVGSAEEPPWAKLTTYVVPLCRKATQHRARVPPTRARRRWNRSIGNRSDPGSTNATDVGPAGSDGPSGAHGVSAGTVRAGTIGYQLRTVQVKVQLYNGDVSYWHIVIKVHDLGVWLHGALAHHTHDRECGRAGNPFYQGE